MPVPSVECRCAHPLCCCYPGYFRINAFFGLCPTMWHYKMARFGGFVNLKDAIGYAI
jgi:hypothetical protein